MVAPTGVLCLRTHQTSGFAQRPQAVGESPEKPESRHMSQPLCDICGSAIQLVGLSLEVALMTNFSAEAFRGDMGAHERTRNDRHLEAWRA